MKAYFLARSPILCLICGMEMLVKCGDMKAQAVHPMHPGCPCSEKSFDLPVMNLRESSTLSGEPVIHDYNCSKSLRFATGHPERYEDKCDCGAECTPKE
jgi:hypothetical protein